MLADNDVFKHRQRLVELQVLERAADADGHKVFKLFLRDIPAVEEDAASRGIVNAGDGVDEGRFAGTVRSDDAEDVASVDVEGDPVDCVHTAEIHFKFFDFQQMTHSSAPLIPAAAQFPS